MSSAVTSSGNRALEQLKVAELRDELKKRGLVQKGAKKDLLERLEEAMLKEGQLAFSLNPLDGEVDMRLGQQELGEVNAKLINTDGEGEGEHIPEGDPQCEQKSERDSELERKAGRSPDLTTQKRELECLGRREDVGDEDIRVSALEIFEGHTAQRELEHGFYNEVSKREEGPAETGVRESEDSGSQTRLVELASVNDNPCSPTVAKDCLIQASDFTDASFSVANPCIGTDFAAGPCVANLDLHATGQQQIKVAEVSDIVNSRSQAEEQINVAEVWDTVNSRSQDLKAEEQIKVAEVSDTVDSRSHDLNAEEQIKVAEVSDSVDSRSHDLKAEEQIKVAEVSDTVDSRSLDLKAEEQIKVAEVSDTVDSRSQDLKAEEIVHIGECGAEDLQVGNIVDPGDSRADDLMVEGAQSWDVPPGSTVSSSHPSIPQLLHEYVQSQGDHGERHSPVKVSAMVDVKVEYSDIKVEEEYSADRSEKDKSQSLEVSDQEFYPAGQLFPEALKFKGEEEKPSVFKAAASVDIKLEEGYRVDRGEKDMPQFFEEFGQDKRDSKDHIPEVVEEEERAMHNPLDVYLGDGYIESEQGVLGYAKSEQGVGDATKGLDVKVEPQAMELSEDMAENGYKPMETHSQAFTGQKRKDEEGESRHQEPAKRQRRWNSGNKLTVEAARPLTTDTIKEIISLDSKDVTTSGNTPRTTTKITATTRPPSTALKIDPFANGGRTRQRIVPPALRSPTTSLRIDRFLRPFTLKAVKELLSQNGVFTDFWMDQIKTHCYVTYSSVEEAIATRNALYDLQWPPSFGNTLIVDFVDPEEGKMRTDGELEKPVVTPVATPRVGAPTTPVQASSPKVPAILNLPAPLPSPPMRDRPALPPKKESEPPVLTLDDLFKKTKAKPHIYYLPLTDGQVVMKLAAREPQSREPMATS